MKVKIINLHKHKPVLNALNVIALVLVILFLTVSTVNAYISSGKYISALSEENEKNTVIIDAGHGGEDPGAIGTNGVYEKDLNLAVAFEIGELLKERGFNVIYTRTEDKLLYKESENIKGLRKISDLKNRCKIAAEYPNSMLLSIHMNSYGDSRYSGTQVYYSSKNENSKILAQNIQSSVKTDLQTANKRAIKSGENMYILENVNNPAVLIECGFITNSDECNKLSEKEYQKRLSLAIVCGIIEYKEKISAY